MSWRQEAREMSIPTAEEINEWADGIVYADTPGGVEVYFDAQSRAWRRVRRHGPYRAPQWDEAVSG